MESPNSVAVAIAFARSHIGDPYVFGATGPHSWDCSGLVMKAYAEAGIILPRTTGTMINVGTPVAKEDLQPGDLVFPDFHHVQIYTGNGKIIEAPQTGEFVIERPMWGFWRARRVVTGPQTGVASGGVQGFGVPVVGGAVDAAQGVFDALKASVKAAEWLSNKHNWLRIAEMFAGLLMIAVALFTWSSVKGAATTAVKGVANAGTA